MIRHEFTVSPVVRIVDLFFAGVGGSTARTYRGWINKEVFKDELMKKKGLEAGNPLPPPPLPW